MTTSVSSWQYSKRGPISTTLGKRDVQLPEIKPGEVLVKIHAAALNPVDWKVAAATPGLLNKLPHTAAADFAGEVVSVSHSTDQDGEATKSWLKEGARIYGFIPVDESMKTGYGSIATYGIAKTTAVGLIPEKMSYVDAAGLTLVGLTAATICDHVKSNDRVLVVGGTTAVGLLLIQMCKAAKASLIIATCSSNKSSAVNKCGANGFVDYKDNVEIQLKEKYSSDPFDVILDCVGAFDTYRACPAYLKKDGVYANIGASDLDLSNLLASVGGLVKNVVRTTMLPAWLGGTPRKFIMAGLDKSFMPKLREYVSSGQVKPWTDKTYTFDEAPQAYEYLIKGRALGKVVVKVIED